MMIRFCSAAVFVLLCFASMVYAADKPLVVMLDQNWPPMEYMDQNQQITGYSADFARALAKETGLNLEIKSMPWDGIFESLNSHHTDIIAASITITEKRKQTMLLSDPYCEARQAILVPVASTVRSMNDLKGLRIGAKVGTTGLLESLPKAGLDKDAKISVYDIIAVAIEDLAKGKLDAVICDSPVAMYYANKKAEYQGKFKIACVTEPAEYYGLALRKDDTELLAKVNKGIKAIKEKGIDKELARKWFGNSRQN